MRERRNGLAGRARQARGAMGLCGLLALLPWTAQAQQAPRLLDGFDDPAGWRVASSNQVSGQLRRVAGQDGPALCLYYDFNGVSGHAAIQRELPIDYPDNYQFGFRLRGDSPPNDLQFKLIDDSGDNVWWVNRPRYDFPAQWTEVRYRKRHIDKAWGPDPERVLRHSRRVEFTVYNQVGGKGSVCFDQLTLQTLPVADDSPLDASARAIGTVAGSQAAFAVDGDPATAWNAGADGSALTLDLGRMREFGGLVLDWTAAHQAWAYRVELSDDGQAWRAGKRVEGSDGGRDYVALPESEARYLRLSPEAAPGRTIALNEARVQPLSFAATPNDFIRSQAADAPRGAVPRGFTGEQPYWTIVGLDGGTEQGLIGEDGAIELAKGGFSIEPFVISEGELVSWADVRSTPSLQDGYLPIPSVDWRHPRFALRTTAFAQGTPERSQLVARYRLSNESDRERDYVLALAVRPLQVNPPSQFLNTPGGFSPIRRLAVEQGDVVIDGRPRVHMQQPASSVLLTRLDGGDVGARLRGFAATGEAALADPLGRTPRQVEDADGLASGAWLYRLRLRAGESREVALIAPLTGAMPDAPAGPAEALQAAVAAQWRGKLDRVDIRVPAQGQALVDTLRTSLGHMLISRIGPRLQPGTRSYSRSWIRDGVMISEGLLRMGREDVARQYLEWYAPYQFNDGMVPCCVDDRGSDPVPENDSHGELIYGIAEYYRYTGDRGFLQRMWPHAVAAFGYMEKLRLSERTPENRARNAAFYGMMPVSISHEGYSAKPMHSYWDNFWALRGYKDAAEMAQIVGTAQQRRQMEASRDQFRADLEASLLAATRQHGIDYLPGAAELGDFDPTSTTIALAPGGEQGRLPKPLLANTFERYWNGFVERREDRREWKDYTPYEWRNVAAFVRLGWRERAWEVVDFFFDDRTPQAWNQWAEVVSRTPRKPFFVGDLPHAWVGSDFVRSALDMFAYTREIDDSIVLAAGVPAAWLDGEGITVARLRTLQGPLGYRLRRVDGQLRLDIPAGPRLPNGGLVLPWPYPGAPGAARINGRPAQWQDGELRITAVPATVEIAAP